MKVYKVKFYNPMLQSFFNYWVHRQTGVTLIGFQVIYIASKSVVFGIKTIWPIHLIYKFNFVYIFP